MKGVAGCTNSTASFSQNFGTVSNIWGSFPDRGDTSLCRRPSLAAQLSEVILQRFGPQLTRPGRTLQNIGCCYAYILSFHRFSFFNCRLGSVTYQCRVDLEQGLKFDCRDGLLRVEEYKSI